MGIVEVKNVHATDVDVFFPGFSRALRSLKLAFVPNKGMPLALSGPSSFYASTTASALTALDHMGALNLQERQLYQSAVLRLRYMHVNPGDISKSRDDDVAWDAQEGASVWNTSVAIWALARTRYTGPEVGRAVSWIIRSYNREEGFAPQRNDVNLFIAANAAHGLRLAGRPGQAHEVDPILNALIAYVRAEAQPLNGMLAWGLTHGAAPDPTATLSALWILNDCGDSASDLRRIESGLNFLRSSLRGSHGVWPMTPIYSRMPSAGHNPQVILSYTPSFIIPLLRMGVHPFDPLVLEPMRWLRAHFIDDKTRGVAGWDNARHDSTPLSFTTSLALWAIHNWSTAVARTAYAEIKHERGATVFVVHGRDPSQKREEIRAELKKRNVPDALFVMEEPSTLDTIFARVTQAALQCDYAIVLATPDDVGALAGAPSPLEPRARQNVVFELGLFLGLFHRGRVSLVTYGDVKLPSDLDGVMHIEMEHPGWSDQLYQALLVAGVAS